MRRNLGSISGSLAALAMAAMMAGSPAAAGDMKVTSGEFGDSDVLANEQVFAGFGCEGGNVSPSLAWTGAPAGTKSFAVTAYDPDAPTGSGWWHWVVVNIPADATGLDKGAGMADGMILPKGALQVRTDFGAPGYGGPCPPQGDHAHRYYFTVHAVDLDALDVSADSSAALVGYYLNFHTLDKATVMGLYKR